MTTGAVTTVIDRLEAPGHARRVRDSEDRRCIYVKLTDEARQKAGTFYAEHAELAESLFKRYSQEQIEMLLEFVKRGREFNDRKAAELDSRTRSPTRQKPRAQGHITPICGEPR